MLQLANQPQSIGQVFLHTFRVWPAVIKKVQLLALLMAIWLILPYWLEPELNSLNPFVWAHQLMHQWPWAIAYFGVMLIFYGAIFYRARQTLNGQSSSFIGAFGVGIIKLIWLIPAVIMAAISLTVGYAFLIIPGLIMMVVFMCYFPLIIVDDLDPVTAYKRSFQLVWNNWWRTAITILLPTLILVGVGIAANLLGTRTLVITDPFSIGKGYPVPLLSNIVELLINALYFPFYAALLIVLLRDLQLRQKSDGQS